MKRKSSDYNDTYIQYIIQIYIQSRVNYLSSTSIHDTCDSPLQALNLKRRIVVSNHHALSPIRPQLSPTS